MKGNGVSNCFIAEPGAPRQVRATYEARKQQAEAQQAMMLTFAGLLFETM